MADEPEDVVFITPDEAQEDFREKLIALLQETRDLGPLIHLCLMCQMGGRLLAHNQIISYEDVMKTAGMNVAHGYTSALHEMMEASLQEGKPN